MRLKWLFGSSVSLVLGCAVEPDQGGLPLAMGDAGVAIEALVVSPPSAPSSITATVHLVRRVELGWAAAHNATSYRPYRCTNGATSSCTAISSWQEARTYTDTTGTPGVTYFYRAKARRCLYGECGVSAFSPYQHGVALAAPPAPSAPASITATTSLVGRVNLGWSSVSNASTYRAYRCGSSALSSCTPISPWQGATSYTYSAGTLGVTYYFRAKARRCDNSVCAESGFSPYQHGVALGAPLAPSAPGSITATTNLVGRVDLTWAASSGASSYRAYRCTSSAFSSCLAISNWQGPRTFSYTGGTRNVTYYFRAKARTCQSDVCAESVFSPYQHGIER